MFFILLTVAFADIVPVEEWVVPTTIEPTVTRISPKILKPTRETRPEPREESCQCPEPKKIGNSNKIRLILT